MEFLDTVKDFFAMLYFIFSSLPKEFQLGSIIVVVLAMVITLFLSLFCDKKDKRTKKNDSFLDKKEKKQPYESMNQPDSILIDNEKETTVDDLKDFSFSAKIDDIEIIEDLNKDSNMPSMKKKKEEVSQNVDEKFENIHLDNFHKVDKIYINNKGIFLLFSISLNAKTIYGDKEDEYLFFDGEKRINPISQKSGYIKKINRNLQIEDEKISIVIISNEIEFSQSSLPIYKTEDIFEKTLIIQDDIMEKEELNKILKSNILKQ